MKMLRRRLALLLALTMVFTSVDSTALVAFAEDMQTEEAAFAETEAVEEALVETEGTAEETAGDSGETAAEMAGAAGETAAEAGEIPAEAAGEEQAAETALTEEELLLVAEEEEAAEMASYNDFPDGDLSGYSQLHVGENAIESGVDWDHIIWYQFTAPAAGRYSVQNFGAMYLYRNIENGGYETSGGSENFVFTADEGETVGLGFYLGRWNSETHQNEYEFTINIVAAPEITSVSVNPVMHTYVERLDTDIWADVLATAAYSDGTEAELRWRSYFLDDGHRVAGMLQDVYGYTIRMELRNADDEPIVSENGCQTGEYTLNAVLDGQNRTLGSAQISVVPLDSTVLGTLQVDTETVIRSRKDAAYAFGDTAYHHWYTFRAENSGEYWIENASTVVVATIQDGEPVLVEKSNDYAFKAQAGTTYYIGFCGYVYQDAEQVYEFPVTVHYVPQISAITFGDEDTFAADIMSASEFLYRYATWAGYADGTEADRLESYGWDSRDGEKAVYRDSHGNMVYIQLKNESGVACNSYDTLGAGTYTIVVSYKGNELAEKQVHLVTVDQLPALGRLSETENGKVSGVCSGEGYHWYTFQPEKTGLYKICGDYYYVPEIFYVADGKNVRVNFETQENGYELRADTLYYVGLRGLVGNEYSAWMRYAPKLTGATVNAGRQKYAAGLEKVADIETTLSYADGTTQKMQGGWYSSYDSAFRGYDSYDHVIWIHVTKDGEDFGSEDAVLQEGTYELSYVCNTRVLGTQTVQAVPVEQADLPVLSVGRNTVQSSDSWQTPKMYSFQATEAGSYFLKDFAGACRYDPATGVEEQYDEETALELAAGETLYIGFYGSKWDEDIAKGVYQFDVELTKAPKIAALKADGSDLLQPLVENIDEWEEYHGRVIRLRMEYDDASVEPIEREINWLGSESLDDGGITDEYGQFIRIEWYKDGEAYEQEWWDDLPAGSYTIRFVCGDVASNDLTFEVKSMAGAAAELKLGEETAVENTEGYILGKFTTASEGNHTIAMDAQMSRITLYDDMGKRIRRTSWGTREISASLEKDKTYVVYAEANMVLNPVHVLVEATPVVTAVELKTKKGDNLAGVDKLTKNIRATLTYDNGTTTKIYGNGWDAYGNGVKCYIDGEKGPDYRAAVRKGLAQGEYTVHAKVFRTGSAVSYDLEETTPATVKRSLPAKEDLTPLTVGELVRTPSGGSRLLYSVTAPEKGMYGFVTEEGGAVSPKFYRMGENALMYEGTQISLNAGESCVVLVEAMAAGAFKVENTANLPDIPDQPDIPDVTEKDTVPAALEPDQTYRVVLAEDEVRKATFTPAETGVYVVESSRDDGDPVVELYQGDDLVGDSDDEDGIGRNFRLIQQLEAGKTYTYELKTYGNRGGSYDVRLEKMTTKVVQKAEFVFLTETVAAADVSNRSRKIRLTYADGTTDIVENYAIDKYGNEVFVEPLPEDEKESETEVTYAATISVYNNYLQEEDRIKSFEATYTVKKLAGLPAVELGSQERVTVEKVEGQRYYYQFTAPETGTYLLKYANQDNMSFSLNIVDGKNDNEVAVEAAESFYLENYGCWVESYGLKGGKTYLIWLEPYEDEEHDSGAIEFEFVKGNAVKSIKVSALPDQKTVYPGTYRFNPEGLEILATYQDGTTKTLGMDDTDEWGRRLGYDFEWVNDKTMRVSVNFGGRSTSFTLAAGEIAMEEATELKEGGTTLVSEYAKFTPATTGTYLFRIGDEVDWCMLPMMLQDEDGEEKALYRLSSGDISAWLEKGETYLLVFTDIYGYWDVTVHPEGECVWTTVSETQPTCTAAGSRTEHCSVHNDDRVTEIPKLGHTMTFHAAVEATCQTAGAVEYYSCETCGKNFSDTDGSRELTQLETPVKEHTLSWEEEKAATCTATGTEVQICTECRTIFDRRETDALGHSFSEWTENPKADCTKKGLRYRTCTLCDLTESEELPAIGHAFGEVLIAEPTDTVSGKEYQVCENCNEEKVLKVLVPKKVVEAITVAQETLDKVDTDETVTVEDVVEQVAQIDNQHIIDNDSMDLVTGLENKLTDEATTIQEAKIGATKQSGDVEATVEGAAVTVAAALQDKTVEAESGSTYSAEIAFEEPTEKKNDEGQQCFSVDINLYIHKDGVRVEENQPQELKAPVKISMQLPEKFAGKNLELLHIHDGDVEKIGFTLDGATITFMTSSFSEFETRILNCGEGNHTATLTESKPATCTTAGEKTGTCENCGASVTETVAPLQHDYKYETLKEATCKDAGIQRITCSRCDYKEENASIPKKDHVWSGWSVEKEVTCTQAGVEKRSCTANCGTTEQREIPQKAHTMTQIAAKAATCTQAGNAAYWTCSGCGKHFADANGQNEAANLTIPVAGHQVTAVPAKEATCMEAGNAAYWICSVCQKRFKDAACTAELSEADTTVGKLTPTGALNAAGTLPLKLNQKVTLKAEGLAEGDAVVEWKSSNTKVATVNANGVVKANKKKLGTATITASLASGHSLTVKVKTQKKDVKTKKVTIDCVKKLTLTKGQTMKITAKVTPISSRQKLKFTSSNKKVATVSSKGQLKAKKKGKATITVQSGSKKVKITVNVK